METMRRTRGSGSVIKASCLRKQKKLGTQKFQNVSLSGYAQVYVTEFDATNSLSLSSKKFVKSLVSKKAA